MCHARDTSQFATVLSGSNDPQRQIPGCIISSAEQHFQCPALSATHIGLVVMQGCSATARIDALQRKLGKEPSHIQAAAAAGLPSVAALKQCLQDGQVSSACSYPLRCLACAKQCSWELCEIVSDRTRQKFICVLRSRSIVSAFAHASMICQLFHFVTLMGLLV